MTPGWRTWFYYHNPDLAFGFDGTVSNPPYPRHRPTLPQDARSGAEGYRDMATGEIVPYTGHDAGHSEEGAG